MCTCGRIIMSIRKMSSSEVSTALRPFYFSVHPDLFGQYPSQRKVNENSLQVLSSFIENVRSDRFPQETTLTFYLKPTRKNLNVVNLKAIKIKLRDKDIEKTVSAILSSCNLPTTYVDNLKKKSHPNYELRTRAENKNFDIEYDQSIFHEVENIINRTVQSQYLKMWLEKNIQKANEKLKACQPMREEISRLQTEISQIIGIKQLILDCGWNISHYRGCLASFQALFQNHPQEMNILKGRTIVFGRDTGISFNGHVLFNSGEVRNNWLDFIRKIPQEDAILLTLPSFEKSVSRVLRDINVVRRKFQPQRMAKTYETNLKRLTTTLSDHFGRYGYPKQWPESLSNYELVVESEAGPLMVSPTGQFIVPASCPSFLLINFITENNEEARCLNLHYQSHKHIEKELQSRCLEQFKLATIEKDDSIHPDFMIKCCSQLLKHKDSLRNLLINSHLYITNYYSVMSDGQICIPWNWKL